MPKRQPSGDQQKSNTGKHPKKSQRGDEASQPLLGDAPQQSEPFSQPVLYGSTREDIESRYGGAERQQAWAQRNNPYNIYVPFPPQPEFTPLRSSDCPEAGTTPVFGSYGSAPRAKPIGPSPYGALGYTPGQSMSGYPERSAMPPPEPRGSGRSAAPIGPSPYGPSPYARPVDNPGQSLAGYPRGSAAPTLGSLDSGRSARPTETSPYGSSPYGRPGDMPRQSIVNPEAGQLFAPTPRRSTTFSNTLQPEFASDQFSYDPPIERPERHHFMFTPVPEETSELAKGFARYRRRENPAAAAAEQADPTTEAEDRACARCYILGKKSPCGRVTVSWKGYQFVPCWQCKNSGVDCHDDREEAERLYGPPRDPTAKKVRRRRSCDQCHNEYECKGESTSMPCNNCWNARLVCTDSRPEVKLPKHEGPQEVENKTKRTRTCARCYMTGAPPCDGIGSFTTWLCRRCRDDGVECNDDRDEAEAIHGPPRAKYTTRHSAKCSTCKLNNRECEKERWPCRNCWNLKVACTWR